MSMVEENTPLRRMYAAVTSNNVAAMTAVLSEHPALLHKDTSPGWAHYAARDGAIDVLNELAKRGLDIDEPTQGVGDTPLSYAIRRKRLDVVRHLLARGVDPNANRGLISAINSDDQAFALVKLLVEHGADVNRKWRLGDEKTGPWMTALSWAISTEKTDIADYLRAHGASMPEAQPQKPVQEIRDEIISYFSQRFGPVRPLALREIVPSPFGVEIHVIDPTTEHPYFTLFTTGMSQQAMVAPPEGKAFQFAELLIYLPADWPLSVSALKDQSNYWPLEWLRRLAAYPHENQTWLGGSITIVSNGDPAKPLAPNCRFTAMLLLADYEDAKPFRTSDERLIKIYTLLPLYPEEHEIEQEHGLPELFRRFDRFGTPKVVNIKRPNVAKI